MKRLFDFLAAFILLVVFTPIILAVAVLVRIKLGKPVLFKQVRPGLNGNPFLLYKFRSMIDSRDENGNLLSDNVRLTSFGKWLRKLSLDELPQFFNVLNGDMSLVGPRPLLMEYLELYNSEQARRHEVRPGITGWAQVNGRNAITWEEKFKLDVWYVDNQTFLLDLRILFFTLIRVLRSEGVNQDNHMTVEKFRGER